MPAQTIDATRTQNPETSNPHFATNPDQSVTHHHFVQNTASKPTQPPNTEFQASQADSTSQVGARQSKPLNPKAAIFVPAQLEYFYDHHRNAYLRQKLIKLDMDGIEEMLQNGQPGEYNFERLGELSRDLALEFVDAGNERAKWIIAIEENYGTAALGGRSMTLGADCI